MRTIWVCVFSVLLTGATFAKDGSSYLSPSEMASIRVRAKQNDHQRELQHAREAADLLATLSDDEIWALVPPPDLLRAINVRFGTDCPVHGAEVFKVGGHYPWIMSARQPYKLECPVGHELYPSNDFASYLRNGRKGKLDTTQKYVDDGNGWIGPEGKPFFFAAYYNFWFVWRATILQGIEGCGKVYLATGDERYAHKAAVCLARVSQVYSHLDWSTQGVSDGKFPSGWTGKINDRIWECDALTRMAVAYDAIFPTLATDEPLKDFARSRGIEDVGAAIERDVLQVGAAAIMDGRVHGNKMELGALSVLALVLDNDDAVKGATTRQMVDWILRGPGELEYTFYNGFDRDGIGGESSPGYSSIWNNRLVQVANNLSRMGKDIASDRKWLRVAKGPAELFVLDGMGLRIGDSGGGLAGARHGRDAETLKFAVKHFKDADAARWLLNTPPGAPPRPAIVQNAPLRETPLFARDELARADLERVAADAAFPPPPYTRNLGGYGLAVLELDDGSAKRAATMYYGGVENFHCNRDRLTLGYFVDDREALTELGYPSHWGPQASYWTQNTPSHYCVMVDGQAQLNKTAGRLTGFVDMPGLKFAAADATNAWTGPSPPLDGKPPTPIEGKPAPPPVKTYERSLALLDTGEKSSLLIDAFLVRGGRKHDYSFHGLPWGKFSIDAEQIREQADGTLAGESIAFGQDPKNGLVETGYQYLAKPRWYAPADVVHASWTGDNGFDQHTWLPNLGFGEVIVADGVPPLRSTNPPTLPYIFLRHQGESDATTSLFLSVTDVTKGSTQVKGVRRIKSDSDAAGGAAIELASGNKWNVYVNRAGREVKFDDGTSGSAAFAAVHVVTGKAVRTKVIGAGRFTPVDAAQIELRSTQLKVATVDYQNNTVRAESAPAPELLGKPGTVVCAESAPHSASYTIRTIDGGQLGFGQTPLITGRYLCAWDASQKKLAARERIDGNYNQFHGRSFVGMTAVSEDLKNTARITGFDRAARTFEIDASPTVAACFNDADGDGRPYVYIADIGPGTTLVTTPFAENPPSN